MSIRSTLVTGGMAVALLTLGVGAALASPGQATGSVNVRSGPGTSYAVLSHLYEGENVDIGNCTNGWCYVTHNGPDGWVSANYLAGGGDYSPPEYFAPPDYEPAPIFINPPHYPRPPFHQRPPFHPPGPPGTHPHPPGPFPGHPHPPGTGNPGHHRPPGGGGGDFCTLHPTAPPCMPGSSHPTGMPHPHSAPAGGMPGK